MQVRCQYALHAPLEVTDALREYDCGVLEGRSDLEGWAWYQEVSDAWLLRGDWAARIEGGESFLDMRARFVPFVERLVQEHSQSDARFALVSQGGLYRCMLPLVLANIDAGFALVHAIDHTSVIVVETSPDGLVCVEWCGEAVER